MALASSPEEAALLTKIRTILLPLHDIVSTDLPQYRALFQPSATKQSKEDGRQLKKRREEEHARLGELLLQMLLKLDGIDAQPDYAEARKQRKAGVKQLQAYIDEVDQLYNDLPRS